MMQISDKTFALALQTSHRNCLALIKMWLLSFKGDEFHSATAETVEEASKLVEAGFEYVCEISGVQLFRKRK